MSTLWQPNYSRMSTTRLFSIALILQHKGWSGYKGFARNIVVEGYYVVVRTVCENYFGWRLLCDKLYENYVSCVYVLNSMWELCHVSVCLSFIQFATKFHFILYSLILQLWHVSMWELCHFIFFCNPCIFLNSDAYSCTMLEIVSMWELMYILKLCLCENYVSMLQIFC
jgi:hypothetical protein